MGVKDWTKKQKKQKTKRKLLTILATAIKKDPTMSIRKHANELKVHDKTVWTTIKRGVTYLPTPPHGQDMTQGQFLSGVKPVSIQSFPSPRLVASPRLKT